MCATLTCMERPHHTTATQPNPHTHTHTLHTGPGALKPFISGASEAGSRCASGTVKKPDLQQELRTSHRHSLSLHYLVSGGSLCMFVLETGLRLAFSLSFTSSHLPLSSLPDFDPLIHSLRTECTQLVE